MDLLSINLGSVSQKINDTVRVTEFVIVPRDELDEVGVKGNTGSGIEDGTFLGTNEILLYKRCLVSKTMQIQIIKRVLERFITVETTASSV
jgi:hypothetical protein